MEVNNIEYYTMTSRLHPEEETFHSKAEVIYIAKHYTENVDKDLTINEAIEVLKENNIKVK